MDRLIIASIEHIDLIKEGATMTAVLVEPDHPAPDAVAVHDYIKNTEKPFFILAPVEKGDYVYIREPYRVSENGDIVYKADEVQAKKKERYHPACRMSYENVRFIFKVEKVYAKKISTLTKEEALAIGYRSIKALKEGWKKMVEYKKYTLNRFKIPYKWEDSPWVWIIELGEKK